MEVILLENIKKLGGLGEVIRVKPGYGRNCLIPQGQALVANAANRAYFEAQRAELEATMQARLQEAEARSEALAGLEITIRAHAGEEGKLFGSVTTQDIANAISEKGVALAKHEIRLPEGPIRQIGQHQIEAHLHSDVNISITVTVVSE